jgi:methylated-DNA-[protein]-cysteine S-methyltransferase
MEVSQIIDSPVGPLRLRADDDALLEVAFAKGAAERSGHPILRRAREELAAYFAGKLTRFELPLDAVGTEFQRGVWRALLEIPFGETRSYADIAVRIGRPAAVRAVGAANGRNPIAIVIPCHRVIGSDGSLTGYGGGEPRKRWLLSHESNANRGEFRLRSPGRG